MKMKNKMMKKKMMSWILVMILAMQLATAIGIRPARTSIAVDE